MATIDIRRNGTVRIANHQNHWIKAADGDLLTIRDVLSRTLRRRKGTEYRIGRISGSRTRTGVFLTVGDTGVFLDDKRALSIVVEISELSGTIG